ncbi:hypothetical protein DC522_15995 [Microvirga sp. KLBC 81]|uniref:hypothetical protein n=1 Tax=Microvirga sp. KLBC 81 TaxID=1862707 RepID=UPI000D50EBB0|nr:hypothetical protein [Microvirga sp. KLBC 81]PVE23366.1 hypothetical protein DC522_15995 [Microvirga sp. KLBC 81]
MSTHVDYQPVQSASGPRRIYSPDLLPHMQSLLAEIADLDCALEKDLQATKNSSYSEAHKSELIQELKRRHRERHTPIAMELAALEKKVAQELQL